MESSERPAEKSSSAKALFSYYGKGVPLDERPRTRCDQCGSLSIDSTFFQELNGQTLCPRCYPAGSNRTLLWLFLGLLGLALLWAARVGNGEGGFALYFVLNVALALLLLELLILPHELLHAGVGLLLGGEIFLIQIGLGPVVRQGRWGNTQIAVHRYPLMGLCALSFRERRWIRLRFGLSILAPLVGHLLLALWLWPRLHWDSIWTGWAWPEMLMIVNGFLLVVNLLPLGAGSSNPTGGTDGKQLLWLTTGKRSGEEIHAAYYVMKAGLDTEQLKSEAGWALTQEGLALYPDNPLLRSVRLVQSLLAERFEGLLPALEEKVQEASSLSVVRALDLNNLAWAIFRLHQLGRLEGSGASIGDGMEYAAWAYAIFPWQPEIEGTYGALLLATGDAERAIWHLKAAAKEQTVAGNRAATLALAAVGHHRLGQTDEAQSLRAQAQALNADRDQSPWAVWVLGGRGGRREWG